MCQISWKEEDKATFVLAYFSKQFFPLWSVKRMYISKIEVTVKTKQRTALLIETEVDHFLQGGSV